MKFRVDLGSIFWRIFDAQMRANGLPKTIKNVMIFGRIFRTHFGHRRKVPYPRFCNTLHAKTRFLGFKQADFWSNFGSVLGTKIDPESFAKSFKKSIEFCINFTLQNPPKMIPKTLPKCIQNSCKNQWKNRPQFWLNFHGFWGPEWLKKPSQNP